MNRNKHRVPLVVIFIIAVYTHQAFAQVETDEYESSAEPAGISAYHINGYLRSGMFADEHDVVSRYAEGSIKLKISGSDYGNAFAEIRYRASDLNEDDERREFVVREGYANLVFGELDFRIGRQVVVWGRADGFNPTNNITPADFTVFSPEEDDKRLSNFVVKSVYNAHPFKIEIDWVPVAEQSALPLKNATLPEGVAWADPKIGKEWRDSALGVKLDVEMPGFECSLSWYNGFHKLPGIRYTVLENSIVMYTRSYRTQIAGADFSTAVGSYGFRGEFAFSRPYDNRDHLYSVPCRQVEYTLGVDREWGDFSIIFQYIGKYVIDFEDEDSTQSTLEREIVRWNRMIFSQHERWNNSVSIRPSINILHETLKVEMLGFANFSTDELFFMPKASYSLSDALTIVIGAQLFFGPEDTMYGRMESTSTAGFMEVKLSF